MTCDELNQRLDDWAAGRLPELKARAMEEHAANCLACYARLDARSRPGRIPQRLATAPALRDATLAAVSRRRRALVWRRVAMSATGIAALAIVATIARPGRKSAADFPAAVKALMAAEHAQAAFAALDAAESEIEDAIRLDPENPDLPDALARLRQQREELSRMVREAGS